MVSARSTSAGNSMQPPHTKRVRSLTDSPPTNPLSYVRYRMSPQLELIGSMRLR